MPRMGRLHMAGGCYHVMGRGLERRFIFRQDDDKRDFLKRLEAGLAATGIDCLAWALMSNHYHLLLRVGVTPLSGLMRKVLGGYATAYNRRHHRAGYVFQNRFKSILCDEESYLLALVRYIHLNPLRAGLVAGLSELAQYEWTGHAALLGNRPVNWQQRDSILARFGDTVQSARHRYHEFVALGVEGRTTVDYSGGGLIRSYGGWETVEKARAEHERKIGDERILGDSAFVEKALRHDCLQVEARTRYARAGWDLDGLTDAVCDWFEVDCDRIVAKGRANNLSIAKAVICYLGAKELGLKSAEIAVRLALSQSGVSAATQRGHEYCQQHGLTINALEQSRLSG